MPIRVVGRRRPGRRAPRRRSRTRKLLSFSLALAPAAHSNARPSRPHIRCRQARCCRAVAAGWQSRARNPAPCRRGKGGEDVAAANLVAEEMRRGRHDGGIGRLGRHPVDAGKMEAADAAGLVTAGAGHVVEAALEARDRADVLQFHAALRAAFSSARDDVVLAEQRIFAAVLARDQAEGRLQVRRREPDRRRRDRALGEESIRDQDGAAVELGEMGGVKQPGLEITRETCRPRASRSRSIWFSSGDFDEGLRRRRRI